MKKKKIVGLVIAVALVGGIVGGSYAWFTSSDSVTNKFSTATTDEPSNPNSGIKIDEQFNPEKAKNLLPGDSVEKIVQVQNTATYNQLMRVSLKKVWRDKDGNEITSVSLKDGKIVPAGTEGATVTQLNNDYIVLNFGQNLTGKDSKWIKETDANLGKDGGFYYYNEVVAANAETNRLLESVSLSPKAANYYKGLSFDVIVTADGVQASNGAVTEQWTSAPNGIKELGSQSTVK